MSNSNESVTALITTTGVPAPAITSSLKAIGNGYMPDGIRRIANLCYVQGVTNEKLNSAKREKAAYHTGLCHGVIGTLATMGAAAIFKRVVYKYQSRNDD